MISGEASLLACRWPLLALCSLGLSSVSEQRGRELLAFLPLLKKTPVHQTRATTFRVYLPLITSLKILFPKRSHPEVLVLGLE